VRIGVRVLVTPGAWFTHARGSPSKNQSLALMAPMRILFCPMGATGALSRRLPLERPGFGPA
jgi:hypothetical protein